MIYFQLILLELIIESHISLINILENKGAKVDPYGTIDFTAYEQEWNYRLYSIRTGVEL
jgi:hypothetical protein